MSEDVLVMTLEDGERNDVIEVWIWIDLFGLQNDEDEDDDVDGDRDDLKNVII